ncbi:RING finger protein 32 [Astyanax mexicanus]|uniref:RING finger protein 32 n=1 Tax=Astyanax mexicanus TaxID=7994 RepID=UPI0020CB20BB|nr:RING finger protein 32 [Astyanax mexicanus]
MLKGRSSSREDRRKLAVAAAALQDHITRSLSGSEGPNIFPAAPSRSHRARQHRHTGFILGEEQEYILEPEAPPLTLAQRLGLVAAPAGRLTAEEWAEVKSRSLQEGDSAQPCVICTEEFRLQPQVLLSCSHVFHKVCLKSLERFSGRRCCPLCRREPYETRVIHDGAKLYREKCAVRIQTCWRGFAARKSYRAVRKLIPPNHPQLRRRYFEEKFQEINESLVRSCCSDVEVFLLDVDQTVAASRDVFRLFDQQQKSVLEEEGEEEEWRKAREKAVQRDISDCPICLTPLHSTSRQVLLLSCSHLLHESCLQAFERFCPRRNPTCPLCRRRYTTRPVRGANTYSPEDQKCRINQDVWLTVAEDTRH